MEQWRSRIYDNYMTNGFQDFHTMKNEFDLQAKYFKKNYLKYMPQNKDAKILELGCGMGHFLYFCQKQGYTDVCAVDASSENVAFIKNDLKLNYSVEIGDIKEYLKTFDGGGGYLIA